MTLATRMDLLVHESSRNTLQLLVASVRGDHEPLERLIARFTPLLLEQARHRLGAHLRRHLSPEDLVQEVWAIALPRLGTLLEDRRGGPVPLLPFLGRILLYHVNNLVRKHLIGKPRPVESVPGFSGRGLAALSAEQSGAITKALRGERKDLVHEALKELPELDRKILIWRGLENHSVREIAVVLGRPENYVSVRYRRALERLRRQLKSSAFDDFA